MNNVTILVLSKYKDLFEGFRENVDRLAPDHWKMLIRTGWEILTPGGEYWLTRQGEDPFSFPRNVNLGWKTAAADDVLICGDDVRIYTDKFVEKMRKIAYSDPNIGVVVPELGGQSIFVCGYFKRSVIETVGPMDEQFSGYGYQDNDYYRRYEALGYYTKPTTEIFAEHSGGTSFFRREREEGVNVQESCDRMRELYERKWGR